MISLINGDKNVEKNGVTNKRDQKRDFYVNSQFFESLPYRNIFKTDLWAASSLNQDQSAVHHHTEPQSNEVKSEENPDDHYSYQNEISHNPKSSSEEHFKSSPEFSRDANGKVHGVNKKRRHKPKHDVNKDVETIQIDQKDPPEMLNRPVQHSHITTNTAQPMMNMDNFQSPQSDTQQMHQNPLMFHPNLQDGWKPDQHTNIAMNGFSIDNQNIYPTTNTSTVQYESASEYANGYPSHFIGDVQQNQLAFGQQYSDIYLLSRLLELARISGLYGSSGLLPSAFRQPTSDYVNLNPKVITSDHLRIAPETDGRIVTANIRVADTPFHEVSQMNCVYIRCNDKM